MNPFCNNIALRERALIRAYARHLKRKGEAELASFVLVATICPAIVLVFSTLFTGV